jgi:sugar/nucleoside kinase (ribokinase family)
LTEIAPLFGTLDYLIANEYEIALLAQSAGVRAGELANQVHPLFAAGAGAVLVRCGAEGATLLRPGHTEHVAAVPCTVRQTVGAGDAFNSGFLYGLVQGMAEPDALAFGARTAAQVVSSAAGVLGFARLTKDSRGSSV